MAALEMSHQHHHIDVHEGTHNRLSFVGSKDSYFSDTEEGSSYSQLYSTMCGSYDGYSFNGVSDHETVINSVVEGSRRASSVSDCSVEGGVEMINAAHLVKVERVCRICHLVLESSGQESGLPIQLGCSCKDDLAAAHKLCAEVWFKIRGNKTCEICQSVARNIVGPNDVEATEQPVEINSATITAATAASVPTSETRNYWQGHCLLNFLLAFMVIAFVISWLLHFNLSLS